MSLVLNKFSFKDQILKIKILLGINYEKKNVRELILISNSSKKYIRQYKNSL